jgi:hypothetical protein
VKNKYVILRHLGDMCLFTSALRASVNKSHIPSLPQNNLYLFYAIGAVTLTVNIPPVAGKLPNFNIVEMLISPPYPGRRGAGVSID